MLLTQIRIFPKLTTNIILMNNYQIKLSKSLVEEQKALTTTASIFYAFLIIVGNEKGLETGIRNVINGRT